MKPTINRSEPSSSFSNELTLLYGKLFFVSIDPLMTRANFQIVEGSAPVFFSDEILNLNESWRQMYSYSFIQTPRLFCLDFMYTTICTDMIFSLVLGIIEKVLRSFALFMVSIT